MKESPPAAKRRDVPPYPGKSPYFVVYTVFSNSKISKNIAVGDLVFMPKGIYFIAGYFTKMLGEPSQEKHFLPGLQLYDSVVGAHAWGQFCDDLKREIKAFRSQYHGTTPEWISQYPDTDIRFISARELKSAKIEKGYLIIGDEMFLFSDKGAIENAVKDYLLNPESSALYKDFKDPLGFFGPVPGLIKVFLALSARKELPELRTLTKASDKYVKDFSNFIAYGVKERKFLSNSDLLPPGFRKRLMAGVGKVKRGWDMRFVAGTVLATLGLIGTVICIIFDHNDVIAIFVIMLVVFLLLAVISKSSASSLEKVNRMLSKN